MYETRRCVRRPHSLTAARMAQQRTAAFGTHCTTKLREQMNTASTSDTCGDEEEKSESYTQ